MSKVTLYSRYWLGSNVDDDSIDLASKGTTTSEIIRLASIKNAISNFVHIVTNRQIPVKFNNGQDSYTDGDIVVISATTKEKTFDAVVGLALHEATHCVWREFPDFLKQFGTYNNYMIPQSLKDSCEDVNITTESRGRLVPSALAMMIKNLMNTFEDRRIDWWLYRTAPGYRPYYEALYSQYWHSTQIDYALQQGKWNTPTVENYINLLINMTNPWFDTRALPELNLIYGLIDVDHINRFDNDRGYKYINKQVKLNDTQYDFDKMPQAFQLAVKVMDIILTNCLPMVNSPQMPQQPNAEPPPKDATMEDNLDLGKSGGLGAGDSADSEDSDDESSEGSGTENSDDDSGTEDSETDDESGDSDDKKDSKSDSDGDKDPTESKDDNCKDKHAAGSPKKEGKLNNKKLEKALEKQMNFLNGDVQKKKVSQKLDKQVKAIEQSGASEIEVSHENYGETTKTKVLVLRRFTREILESGAFPFTPGMRMARRGGTKQDGWDLQAPSSKNWKPSLDQFSVKAVENGFRMGNILAQRLQIRNMKQVTRFNRRDRGKIERRRLHALGAGDTSVFFKDRTTKFAPVLAHMTLDSSSSMYGEKWTQALTVGIAVAVAASKINNLDFVLSMRSGIGVPCIAIIYDSRVDKPMKIRQLFPYLTTIGNTPEGLCFAAIMDDLLSERHGERFFINLSDGQPFFYGYSGTSAWKHTREQINILRGSGLKILSYFITDGGMYSWSDGDSKEGFETMYGKDAQYIEVDKITSLTRTLNRLFLIR